MLKGSIHEEKIEKVGGNTAGGRRRVSENTNIFGMIQAEEKQQSINQWAVNEKKSESVPRCCSQTSKYRVGGEAYSLFVACLSHMTIDHASLARRGGVYS